MEARITCKGRRYGQSEGQTDPLDFPSGESELSGMSAKIRRADLEEDGSSGHRQGIISTSISIDLNA
jgi:hypothetical protein